MSNRRDVLKLTAGLATLATLSPTLRAASAPAPLANMQARADRDRSFDDSWRFLLGDGPGFESPGLIDEGWRSLNLPHDWSIEDLPPLATSDEGAYWRDTAIPGHSGPFDRTDGTTLTAFTIGGIGWYRKRFQVPDLPADGRVELLFDGVFMNSDVWLNGRHLGNRPYGYSAFAYDLTPFLNSSEENVVAVRARNVGRNSRWYSGSGIYRPVKLTITGPVRFARWGVGITTPQVSRSAARVQVSTRIEGVRPGVTLIARVFDPAGRAVGEHRAAATAEVVLQTLAVTTPRLWSPDTPELYRLDVELRSGDAVFDRLTTDFGIRKVEMDARRGLRINDRPCKLRGGCLHHDNGLLGAAAFPEAEERRVALMKARGFNAIRTAHNPPSAAFLDACDRLGMLVLDEAFDVWNQGKNSDDYHQWFKDQWRSDLAAMVLRDRNHPSVILWSIGNEIPEKLTPQGNETAWMLVDEVRRLDPTRPVTAAVNGFAGRPVEGRNGKPDQPVFMYLDVAGYNYKWPEYERDHVRFPGRIMLGTESYPGELYQVWTLIEKLPYAIGDFVWTGMDHFGEAGLGSTSLVKQGAPGIGARGAWPWIVNNSGDIDLIGEQKPQSLARDVVWGLSPVEMTVQRPVPEDMEEAVGWASYSDELASWTWRGREGHVLAVRVYTRGDRVELFLNGKSVGVKALLPADLGKAQLAVPYAAGELVAIASRGGAEIGRKMLTTAGAPAALHLRPYRPSMHSANSGLAFVTVEVVDAMGRLVPDAIARLTIALDGPAELAAFGSANPRRPESVQSTVAYSFHGRALAILRGTNATGRATVHVSCAGLAAGELRFPVI